jgi:hypothetical protein
MSAITTPISITPDIAGGSAGTTSRPRSRRRNAWIAGSVAGVLVAGAVALAWAQATPPSATDTAPRTGDASAQDLTAHGGAGQAFDGRGEPLGQVPVTPADIDLIAHGGAGSVWTVSGTRVR